MTEAVICEPVRTPVGRYGGMFKDVPVTTLASTVVKGWSSAPASRPGDIDDVIFGQGYANGEAAAIGRIAALDAGLDVTVPGLQIDRRCGSGLQAVLYACMQVATGGSDLVLAGGAESMSQAEYYVPNMRWNAGGTPTHARPPRASRARTRAAGATPSQGGMIETAENVGREYGITREEQDEWAVALARAGRRGDRGGPVRRRDDRGHRSRSARATRSSSPATSTLAPARRSRAWPGSSR